MKVIEYKGQTHTISEWVKITGISETVIRRRIKRGVPMEKVFFAGNIRGDYKDGDTPMSGLIKEKKEILADLGVELSAKQISRLNCCRTEIELDNVARDILWPPITREEGSDRITYIKGTIYKCVDRRNW